MPPTEAAPRGVVARYVGRYGPHQKDRSSAQELTFDDETRPAQINAAARSATILVIDDPMSYPWELIEPTITAPLVVDATRCSASDCAALEPVLRGLTEADTILDPTHDLAHRCATRSTTPEPTEWNELHATKQAVFAEREILARIEREIGEHRVVHSVTPSSISAVDGGFAAFVSDIEDRSNVTFAGVWGVRAAPGSPLRCGLVAFAPASDPSV